MGHSKTFMILIEGSCFSQQTRGFWLVCVYQISRGVISDRITVGISVKRCVNNHLGGSF